MNLCTFTGLLHSHFKLNRLQIIINLLNNLPILDLNNLGTYLQKELLCIWILLLNKSSFTIQRDSKRNRISILCGTLMEIMTSNLLVLAIPYVVFLKIQTISQIALRVLHYQVLVLSVIYHVSYFDVVEIGVSLSLGYQDWFESE